MNLKVLEGLKQLQRNIGKQTDINDAAQENYNIKQVVFVFCFRLHFLLPKTHNTA